MWAAALGFTSCYASLHLHLFGTFNLLAAICLARLSQEIQYTPPQYIFTSSLPTSISITTDASALDITVECDGNGVFTTTLYPYNREVVLYDIRSIIEGYLLSKPTRPHSLRHLRRERGRERQHPRA